MALDFPVRKLPAFGFANLTSLRPKSKIKGIIYNKCNIVRFEFDSKFIEYLQEIDINIKFD